MDANWKSLPPPEVGPCPPADAVAAFTAGGLENAARDRFLAHLTACASCRADVAAARGMADDATPAPAALRVRLYGMGSRKSLLPRRLALAAAALFLAVLGTILFWPAPRLTDVARRTPPPLVPPSKKDEPREVKPEPTPAPLPGPSVEPAPPPVVPKPEAPKIPVPTPAPKPNPQPVPPPEPPVLTRPDPVPAPPTRPTLRGSLASIVGSPSLKSDGDRAFVPLKVGQSREFVGAVELRADAAAVKFRVGDATFFLRPKSEATLTLFEGETLVRLAAGEACFDVAPGRGVFHVETVHGRVRVTGTRFRVGLEKNATEVAVLRGSVNFGAVALAAGEESSAAAGAGPKPPSKLDARAFQWVRALEETLVLEAEAFALQGGMAALPDAAASGGRAIGSKTASQPGKQPSAEARLQVKQPGLYAVWIRVFWGHNVPSALTIQVHTHAPWNGNALPFMRAWQWVRLGTYDLPGDAFRVQVVDPRGDSRVDQLLLTTDLDYAPESDRK